MIVSAIGQIKSKAESKKIRIIYTPVSCTAKFDSKWTQEALFNILDNAVKYSEDNSHISIRLTKDAKNANLEIKNKTKENLDNESLSHVFERFYRTDSSRNSETGGYGIGLSVAKAIVTSCGGSINAYTEDGSEFIIKAV